MPVIINRDVNSPTCTKDELIVVLSLYKKTCPKNPSTAAGEEYAAILGKMANNTRMGAARSQGSVGLRVSNFVYLNDKKNDPRTGLFGGAKNKNVISVWSEFKSEFTPDKVKQRGRLEKEAERIIASSENSRGNKDSGEKIEYDIYGSRKEGNKVFRLQETRERDPSISRKKKQQVLKGKGFLACEACSFIFKDTYGKHGEDFIECHHTKPVAKMEHNDVTSLSDLALVCSNCHRMIHKQDPAITIGELCAIIAENK